MSENEKNTVESEMANNATNDTMGHKILANAIMFILKNDTISVGNLISRFKFDPEIALSIISAFKGTLLGEEIDKNGTTETVATIVKKDVADYSNILSYQDGILTLNEGFYFSDIASHVNLTITSNDKPVYANYIVSSVIVKTASGSTVSTTCNADKTSCTYTMPESNVTVTVQYVKTYTVSVTNHYLKNSSSSFTTISPT